MKENEWIELTRFEFVRKEEIIPSFTYLLDKDNIRWRVASKLVPDDHGNLRRRWGLLREPLKPIRAKPIPKRRYTRGIQARNLIEGKLERAIQKIIDYQLGEE